MTKFTKKGNNFIVKKIYHKNTKKKTKYTIKKNDQLIKNNQNFEKLPDSLQKYLNKYNSLDKKDMIMVTLKPFLYKNTILLGNQIQGLGDILKIQNMKEKFKTFFTYDYMYYLNFQ
jgi:hypothetical protein